MNSKNVCGLKADILHEMTTRFLFAGAQSRIASHNVRGEGLLFQFSFEYQTFETFLSF